MEEIAAGTADRSSLRSLRQQKVTYTKALNNLFKNK
jgi:hypothetical protein